MATNLSSLRTEPANVQHLLRLTDDVGVLEHALGAVPRRSFGYCLDDNARALIAVCRSAAGHAGNGLARGALERCAGTYLAFIQDAWVDEGWFRDRLTYERRWLRSSSDDASGRALWGLGVAVSTADALADWSWIRDGARRCFDAAAGFATRHLRAAAHCAVGAAEVLSVEPGDPAALGLARRSLATLRLAPVDRSDSPWPWPEPRLTYANALVAEGFIAAGAALGDQAAVDRGVALLEWLCELSATPTGHLSFVATGGWAPGERRLLFDQQPIEASSTAEAAARAWRVTGEQRWLGVLERCAAWFHGANDGGVSMIDPTTGGGFDGLTASGRNVNQGAESTIAAVTTLQLCQAASVRAASR
jgi:hypothetical protein